jgi:hypothetical protein
MLDWTTLQSLFTWDGSYRDLYIFATDIHDWQRLIDGLRTRDMQLTFSLDGVVQPLPPSLQAVFAAREYASPFLSIVLDHIQINCHFFGAGQIEFDIDPREITDTVALSNLLTFMDAVGSILQKEVRLTPENLADVVLLRYNPATGQIETG